jgi:hypothetical protein
MTTEQIIQKCFGITHWAAKRGRATLAKDQKEFDRCDANIKGLVNKLIKVIKDDT